MMKYLLTALILFLSISTYAQTGSLTGMVKTADDQPAEFVNILVKGTSLGTTTDINGRFSLSNIKTGTRTLIITYVGLKKREITVNVDSNKNTEVPTVTLEVDYEELKEVVIIGDKTTNKFANKESDYVAKLPLKDIENPQVYTAIDSRLLKEQVITNFNDALNNAPGITRLWESTGRGSDGAGYYSLRGFAVQPTMVNGLPGLTNGGLDPANIEKIEVIKGPSGTLYGSSLISYGGLINISTKKPYNHFGGEITYITGSYGLNRITVDINTPLDSANRVLLRVNSAYHSENSFQDAGFKKSFFIAPSLSYKVNSKLSFLVNTEFLSSESTNQTMLFLDRGAEVTVPDVKTLGYDYKKSYTSNDLSIKNPTYSIQAQMNYQISGSWRSQTALSRSSAQSDGYYSYLYETSQYYPIEGSVFTRYINKQNSTTMSTDIQQNFIGDFKLGSLRNRMVVGIDYFHNAIVNNSTGYGTNGSVYIGDASTKDINENVFGITDEENYITNKDNGVLSEAAVADLLASASISNINNEQEIVSAYVSDVLNISPSLSAMASLRIDRFIDKEDDDKNQTALSPKFGLVYQLIPDQLCIFSNYMNGFSNVAPRQQGDQTVENFDPEQANQWEIGSKLHLFSEKLVATFSYYDIKVSDVVRQDPGRSEGGQVFYLQDGENYSKGFEFDIIANPFPGFNLVAGYSHNDSKIENTDQEYNGRRPENAGSQDLINMWASYHFIDGPLDGFGLGFGGNYASEYATLNRQTTGAFTLPEYLVLNTSLFYNTEALRLALKLDNLTDKEYYKGWSTINPQKPRSISASLTYKF